MSCDPSTLARLSKCFCFGQTEAMGAQIYLACIWSQFDLENPPPPCQQSVAPGPGGTIIISWVNPVAYTSIEVWHVNIQVGFISHIETTLPGNTTSWQTPALGPGDFFIVRGVLGDDKSGFATGAPCP